MTAISVSALAGLTVEYNGVQFGGGDSLYQSAPPTYSFQGEFVYDDARRAIVATRYVLTLRTYFYGGSEAATALTIGDLRKKLSAVGQELTIQGLGTAFDSILYKNPNNDLMWGPKPLSFQATPMGQIGWEVIWSVEFYLKECNSVQTELYWTAFNFDTTWENDFEGLGSRTISGYVEIAIHRDALSGVPNTGKIPAHIADEVRDSITILVPEGFRRVRNVWREGAAKNRLDFVVTDEVLPGDYLPEGITAADGSVDFDSLGPVTGKGFAEAFVTLSMRLRAAPNQPRNLPPLIFLITALTKQNAMAGALAASGDGTGTVIPASLRISAGKFDRARDWSFSMSWMLTKCLNEMLLASGLWEPAVQGSYQLWRTSVEGLWNNRGLAGLRSSAAEAAVIDLCSQVNSATIGNSPSNIPQIGQAASQSLACPPIPDDGGWIGHEIKVSIKQKIKQTWHAKAINFLANLVPGNGVFPLIIPSQNEEDDVEYNGSPETRVLVQYKYLRIVQNPTPEKLKEKLPPPILKTIGGQPTFPLEPHDESPIWAFDVLTCPVYFRRGYREYRIQGAIDAGDLKGIGSKTSCGAGFDQATQEGQ